MFDDDPHFLRDGGGVQAGKLHDRGDGATRVDQGFFLGVVELVLDAQEHVVCRVVGEHVENEAFFDGLGHRVGVEGPPVAILVLGAEQAQGLGLGRGGERDEGDVAGGGDGRVLGGEQFVGADVLGVFHVDVGEEGFEAPRAGPRLGGVGFVGDDRPVASAQFGGVFDELHDLGEGLERAGDDVVAFDEGFLQLRGFRARFFADGDDQSVGGVDEAHVASDVFVEDGAVGDDDDGVEGGVRLGIDVADEAVAEPGDGFGFAGARGVPDQVASAGPRGFDVADDAFDGAQLVEAREDQAPVVFLAAPTGLVERVVLEDAHEGGASEDVVPQVVGG